MEKEVFKFHSKKQSKASLDVNLLAALNYF